MNFLQTLKVKKNMDLYEKLGYKILKEKQIDNREEMKVGIVKEKRKKRYWQK